LQLLVIVIDFDRVECSREQLHPFNSRCSVHDQLPVNGNKFKRVFFA
jgi:hypothetical protein